MICKICSQNATLFATAQVLEKYNVQYFQCHHCGFTQTESPYWLNEAYSEPITNSDIGLVERNILLSKISKALILAFYNPNARFVDYGGGYGLFVRLMRDSGLDFYRFDKLCTNLFAKGWEAAVESQHPYELVTAFEVFEHLVQPLNEFEQMLRFSRNILFSTLLIPVNNPKPIEWWYYGLDHGQHVALYTRKSLAIIAEKFHLHLYTNGSSLHMFTEKRISPHVFNFISRYKVSNLLSAFIKRRSLLGDDYFRITGKRSN